MSCRDQILNDLSWGVSQLDLVATWRMDMMGPNMETERPVGPQH